ncbi:hypothetical protein QJQ45_008807 [Haematococcus lacustris]|nr:hypothetical protein QJQ45_008807 [Haematococcus lacustris]
MPSHRRSVCLPVVATVCLMLSQAVLASRPPAPPMYTPSPQLSTATGTSLIIVFYGLDLWSLMTSWGSGMQALLEAQQPPSLRLQDLSAPGMCASHLLALNTTALLNTSRTAQELMPALSYFVTDVAQLVRDYLRDASITVNVPDFCAGNRTFASFFANGTRVNETWPTLRVTINLPTVDPESRGALTTRDTLGFFTLYGMPFQLCQVFRLPNSPPPSPSPPQPSPPPSPSPPTPPP